MPALNTALSHFLKLRPKVRTTAWSLTLQRKLELSPLQGTTQAPSKGNLGYPPLRGTT